MPNSPTNQPSIAKLPVPNPPEPLHLRVTSDTASLAAVRQALEAYATAVGFDESAVAELGLVVNEAMANIIRHAYANQAGKPIELEASPVEQPGVGLVVRLRDWGNGINPETAPKRGYVPGEPGGLGLVCLKRMMDSVEYTPQPDGMLLTMTKRPPTTPRQPDEQCQNRFR